MVLNVVFVFPLMWYFDMGHVGLALATSASAWINAGLLFIGLRRGGVPLAGVFGRKYALRLLVAVMAMAVLLTLITPEVARWLEADLWWRVSRVSVLVVTGLGSFILLLGALGLRLKEIKDPSLH
ncbi:MAG: lipid II flippase MurJ, partial [Halieaceae bacterium]